MRAMQMRDTDADLGERQRALLHVASHRAMTAVEAVVATGMGIAMYFDELTIAFTLLGVFGVLLVAQMFYLGRSGVGEEVLEARMVRRTRQPLREIGGALLGLAVTLIISSRDGLDVGDVAFSIAMTGVICGTIWAMPWLSELTDRMMHRRRGTRDGKD